MRLLIKEYKNYKAVCEENGMSVKTGKSKQLHMQEIERYNNIEKVGNKIIVHSHKDTVAEKVDGRKNNRGSDIRNRSSKLYGDYMEQLLMYIITDEGQLVASKYKIVSDWLNIITDFANDCSMNGGGQLIKELECSTGLVNAYITYMQNIIQSNMKKSLKDLQKKGYITWSEKYQVLRNGSAFDEMLDDDEEIAEIEMAKRKVMKDMDLDYKDLMQMKINKKFKGNVCKELDSDIFNFWKVYDIELVNENYEFTLSEEEARNKLVEAFMIQTHKKLFDFEIDGKHPYQYDKNIDCIIDIADLMWNKPEDMIDTKNSSIVCHVFSGKYKSKFKKLTTEQEQYNKEIIIMDRVLGDEYDLLSGFNTYDYEDEGIPF